MWLKTLSHVVQCVFEQSEEGNERVEKEKHLEMGSLFAILVYLCFIPFATPLLKLCFVNIKQLDVSATTKGPRVKWLEMFK